MQKTIDFINEKTNNFKPEVGIILGSGLGDFADNFESISVSYSDIPGFETSKIQGHEGKLVFIKGNREQEIGNSRLGFQPNNIKSLHQSVPSLLTPHSSLVIMQGRYHFYEGYPMQKLVYPVKVMKKLGVKTLIITNAAGAVNKKFKPSDLMIITDHINLMGTNPLIGENDDSLGPRFADMSEIYKKDLIKKVELSAKELGIKIQKGVYAGGTGPSYETPAEIRMLKAIGADAAGMSTVPEAIVANYCGINVLGISCITNYAAGIQKTPLSHQEVIQSANRTKEKFQKLLLKILEKI